MERDLKQICLYVNFWEISNDKKLEILEDLQKCLSPLYDDFKEKHTYDIIHQQETLVYNVDYNNLPPNN